MKLYKKIYIKQWVRSKCEDGDLCLSNTYLVNYCNAEFSNLDMFLKTELKTDEYPEVECEILKNVVLTIFLMSNYIKFENLPDMKKYKVFLTNIAIFFIKSIIPCFLIIMGLIKHFKYEYYLTLKLKLSITEQRNLIINDILSD